MTQWEIVAATPQIYEQFPFPIRDFHSDNGSEFVNYTVPKEQEDEQKTHVASVPDAWKARKPDPSIQ